MFSIGNLLIACWLIFLGYWALNWLSVKPTQERSHGFRNLRWAIFAIIILVFVINHFGFQSTLHIPGCHIDWRGCHYPLSLTTHDPLIVEILSLLFTIAGLITAIIARRTLADNWSSEVDIKKNHKLVTSGIYSYVRHPIYTGVLLMGTGSLLYFWSVQVMIIMLIVLGMFTFKMYEEEKLLTKHFPKEYPAYKKKVKALVPYII